MKQLLILSGKGGTGKTTLASAFIKFSKAKVFADCDVDAPNLHLVLNQSVEPKRSDYFGLPKAEIDPAKCISCGLCMQHCRFDSINNESGYKVDYYACEGCGVCEAVCPADAIALKPAVAGELMLYANDTVFSTAELKMGSGTSGMLVSEVKKQMKEAAQDADFAIIDGSPGIGCPVIASISGVDLVLIVAEPSVSGISDMERIVSTAEKFQTRVVVCINKYDTNIENSNRIMEFCKNNGLPFAGKVPYDSEAIKAVNSGISIADMDCSSGRAAREVFKNTFDIFLSNGYMNAGLTSGGIQIKTKKDI